MGRASDDNPTIPRIQFGEALRAFRFDCIELPRHDQCGRFDLAQFIRRATRLGSPHRRDVPVEHGPMPRIRR